MHRTLNEQWSGMNHSTGVPHFRENATFEDPTVGLRPGSLGDPRGVGRFLMGEVHVLRLASDTCRIHVLRLASDSAWHSKTLFGALEGASDPNYRSTSPTRERPPP